MGAARRGLLLDQWRGIQEDEEAYDDRGEPSAANHRRRRLNQAKEQWYGPPPLVAPRFTNESRGFSGRGPGLGYRRLG